MYPVLFCFFLVAFGGSVNNIFFEGYSSNFTESELSLYITSWAVFSIPFVMLAIVIFSARGKKSDQEKINAIDYEKLP